MLQNLKLFGGSAETVDPLDYDVELPEIGAATRVAEQRHSQTASDQQAYQRGTAQNLKDVKGPSAEDLEADFAFMSEIMQKAKPAAVVPEATSRRADVSVTRIIQPAVKSTPKTTTAPTFVPLHKRGNGPNGGPMHAVQAEPRSLTPAFLSTDDVVEQPDQDIVAVLEEDNLFLDIESFSSEDWDAPETAQELEPAAEAVQHPRHPQTAKPNLPDFLRDCAEADTDELLPDFPEPPAVLRKLLSWIPKGRQTFDA